MNIKKWLNNEGMQRRMTAKMDITKEKRKTTKRWADENEEDFKLKRIRNLYRATRGWKEWVRIMLEGKFNSGL